MWANPRDIGFLACVVVLVHWSDHGCVGRVVFLVLNYMANSVVVMFVGFRVVVVGANVSVDVVTVVCVRQASFNATACLVVQLSDVVPYHVVYA